MAASYRTYFPVESVSLAAEGSVGSGYRPVHGLQSIGMTTTFNLENILEIGQLETYESVENLPNVEMTLEKVLDGYPLIYHLASPTATNKTLGGRSVSKADVVISLFSDSQDNASGVPLTQVYTSGMYFSALNYTLPVNGQCRESITLVGNDKLWKTSGFYFNGQFNGGDSPLVGVQRRENVKMGNAAAGGSIWPSIIPGNTVVNGSGYNVETNGQFGVHYQDVTISVSPGREDILELGRRKPYFRYLTLPTAVDCTINVLPAGNTPGDLVNANSNTTNLTNEPIVIKLTDGTVFDLGSKNKLLSTTWSGGGTDGTPLSIAFAFQNFNTLSVTHPQDPAGLT